MNKNEIKKALYKQKPIARQLAFNKEIALPQDLQDVTVYVTTLNTEAGKAKVVEFRIPNAEMQESFGKEEPAQLLIRWMVVPSEGGNS